MFPDPRAETFYDDCDRVADWCVAIVRWSNSPERNRFSLTRAFSPCSSLPATRVVAVTHVRVLRGVQHIVTTSGGQARRTTVRRGVVQGERMPRRYW